MGDKPKFFEFDEFVNPIQKLAREYKEGPSQDILQHAIELSKRIEDENDIDNLVSARESVRREVKISEAEIEDLEQRSDQVGEWSYLNQYVLMEIIQAAAVGNSSLMARNMSSLRLAVAAKNLGRYERARQAYADNIEGLQIMRRLFRVDEDAYFKAEDKFRKGWDSLKDNTERQLEIFDPIADDPSEEWMDLVIWNSDLSKGQGLLAQIDAIFRLAIRFEHWQDKKRQQLTPHVEKMLVRCGDLASGKDFWLALRCMVTVGDALIEVSGWNLASRVFRHLRKHAKGYEKHPLFLHGAIQAGICDLMVGDEHKCRSQLETLPLQDMESQSELILTVAGELARYIAVDYACKRKCGEPGPENTQNLINDLLKEVGIIVCRQPKTRVDYLRTLYFMVLARDVESMMMAR